MKKLLAVACLSLAVVFAAPPLHAATRVLTVYPQQLLEWYQVRSDPGLVFHGNNLAGSGSILYPIKLPIGATVKQLKVLGYAHGNVRLVRLNDSYFYNEMTDDLANVSLANGMILEPTTDIADGPAPARIAAGYHYFLLVVPGTGRVGKIQVFYRMP